jgi:Cu+-exporting ATPase
MCCCSEPNKDPKDATSMTTVDPTKSLATDPVCGMTIDSAKAPSVEHQGMTFYFCCQGCITKFRADPAEYLQPKQAPLIQLATKKEAKADYTCPMHPEVHKMGPGSCPKCGMALEPATIEVPESRTEYTCPMHPQIVRDAPGSCPICGMALEPRTVSADEENPELVSMTRRFWAGV